MQKRTLQSSLAFLALCLLVFSLPVTVHAQSSGSDLVSAVNALRTANGLPPYQVDAGLMAFAQQHSEYQASIGETTHTHIDGTSPEQDGVFENVAQGNGLPADTIVNQIWTDAAHRSTMLGIKAGYIGAGVATANGVTFYTIDVRKEEGFSYTPQTPATPAPGQKPSTPQPPPATALPTVAMQTSTPHPDGMVVHVVGNGQTLWDISLAYGVSVADLQQLNNLSASTEIYPGQKLLIRLPNPTLAAAAARTATAQRYTPTPTTTATRTRRPTATPTLTHTPRPSGTSIDPPTSPASSAKSSSLSSPTPFSAQTIGIGLIVACVIGLAILGWSSLRQKG